MEEPGERGRGMQVRIIFSIITMTLAIVGSLLYVTFPPGSDYTLFQKIVVLFVTFVLAVAVISIAWVTWAGRRGWMKRWY